MLSRLRQLTARIPEPYRVAWRTYGAAALLLASVAILWLAHGERFIVNYLEGIDELSALDKARIGSSSGFARGFSAGYVTGYMLAHVTESLYKNPWHVLAMLSVAWSVAVLLYRYWFKNLLAGSSWVAWLGAVLYIAFVQVPLVASALTAWTGRNDGSRALSLALHGWFIAYAFWNHLRIINKARRELTETATQAELTALKAQINPHFLFNSLNNIFGTALTEGGHQTPDGVQRLSGLLRYQLEKAQQTDVDLTSELHFLDDYVQFRQQLLPNAEAVDHNSEWDKHPATIAPLLLTPLFDYALQHQTEAANVPLSSQLTVKDQFLNYQLTYPLTLTSVDASPIENLRLRLEKLYPGNHTLHVDTAGGRATMQLTIAL